MCTYSCSQQPTTAEDLQASLLHDDTDPSSIAEECTSLWQRVTQKGNMPHACMHACMQETKAIEKLKLQSALKKHQPNQQQQQIDKLTSR